MVDTVVDTRTVCRPVHVRGRASCQEDRRFVCMAYGERAFEFIVGMAAVCIGNKPSLRSVWVDADTPSCIRIYRYTLCLYGVSGFV